MKLPAEISIVPNERMPETEWALIDVASGGVTVIKDDGSQEQLRGTKLARFKRWILRSPTADKGERDR